MASIKETPAQSNTPQTTTSPSSSSKRKAHDDTASTSKVLSFTSRNPPWTYLKLQLTHQPDTSTSIQSYPLDPVTAKTYLTSALSQFLGLTGSAISIDILKISSPSTTSSSTSEATSAVVSKDTDKIVWIRVPRADSPAVVAALSSWIGGTNKSGSVAWRVCAKGNYLGAVVNGNGNGGDLFVP